MGSFGGATAVHALVAGLIVAGGFPSSDAEAQHTPTAMPGTAPALAEKLSALLTEEYLEARAARGTRRKFLAALDRVPLLEAGMKLLHKLQRTAANIPLHDTVGQSRGEVVANGVGA